MSGLSVSGLRVRYGSGRAAVPAVDGVDLELPPGGVLGLVGESGSGKSTLGRALLGLAPVSAGTATLDGDSLLGPRRRAAAVRRSVQMVFQDPHTSLDPRMSVRESLLEGVRAAPGGARRDRDARVAELLELVGLEPATAAQRPRQLSGGQRQRVAIARALAAEPRLLVADEITSALDVSVQGAVLNLLRRLQREQRFSLVFISHDLAVVRYVADRVAVMYCGRIVEVGRADDIVARPEHPYTQALVDGARPLAESFGVELLPAEPADPRHPPSGCRFHPRCPVGPLVHPERDRCRTQDPQPEAASRPHQAACFYAGHLRPGGSAEKSDVSAASPVPASSGAHDARA